jgi:hypothetical protein
MNATHRTLIRAALIVPCFALALSAARAADDPLEVDASEDTWLSSDYTGKAQNRGEKDEMQLYGKTDDTGNRALIKFDMKKIPAGFKSAVLRVTAWNFSYTTQGSSYLRCHAVTNAWNQETATWDIRLGTMKWTHAGGDWDPKPVSGYYFSGPVGGGGDRDVYFDLTSIVRDWQAQPNKNEGVAILVEKGCTAEIRLRTKEFANANAHPKLLLNYQKPAQKMASIIPGDQMTPYEPFDPTLPTVTISRKPDSLKLNEAFEAKFSASRSSP